MRGLLVVLFDGVQSLDVTGPLEVFTHANRWRDDRGAAPAYEIRRRRDADLVAWLREHASAALGDESGGATSAGA